MQATTNPLQLYFKQISKIPEIGKREFEYLYRRIKKGDKKSKKRLVEGNLRLVISIAAKYQHSSLSFLDIIEEGNMGLMKAVEKYKKKKGSSFSTYATWWIKQAIRRAIDNQSKTIRIPTYALENVKTWVKNWERIYRSYGRKPSVDEIAQQLKFSLKEVKNVIHNRELMQGETSLDKTISEDENISMKDVIGDNDLESRPEGFVDRLRDKENLLELLDILNEKERKIVTERFGLDVGATKTLKQIGKELGISRERVRQLEENALSKMKKSAKRKNLI